MAQLGPLLVIVGATASGKSALALELAECFNGEIICADSRTIYSDMDIGTAKPSPLDRARVPHHGLDLVSPNQPFTVADFKRYADMTVQDISVRGRLPILVGGSGLYIDAVIYDFQFRALMSRALRDRLNAMEVHELQQIIREQNLVMPVNTQNPRHLIRVIETHGQVPKRRSLRPSTLILGIKTDRSTLKESITARTKSMFDNGFMQEAELLVKKYGRDCPALQAPGYRAYMMHQNGNNNTADSMADFIKNDLNVAKRQVTWFKRNKSIHWISNRDKLAKTVDLVTSLLDTL